MTVLQKLFSFQGRLRRRDYWLFSFLVIGMVIVLFVPLIVGFGLNAESPWIGLIPLVFIWPSLAMMVKRIHDRNKSGWLTLVYWTPSVASNILEVFPGENLGPIKIGLGVVLIIIGLWFLIEFGFMDGTQGPNRYGKSPKGVGGDTPDRLEEVFA
ncbi:hypothetical protein ASD38_12770 [Caulobacter sp. Root487D2Y]|uniref:DUF805 domain-containing protein n=1 Tax=Caulobacter sp. Root487D2Y TaxID=1736547 RepID=UPI0006F2E42D|nr:DUF805 domain-containing protein [Caulobacter sp. Root487D2Y]KQY30153.1 hypothetical protein ASD38_12770 [Caulobacter sp. Root487D2Y]